MTPSASSASYTIWSPVLEPGSFFGQKEPPALLVVLAYNENQPGSNELLD